MDTKISMNLINVEEKNGEVINTIEKLVVTTQQIDSESRTYSFPELQRMKEMISIDSANYVAAKQKEIDQIDVMLGYFRNKEEIENGTK